MNLLSDYQLQVQELVHDTAGIDYTQAELTTWVNNARNRIALDFHNVRYLFQNASLIAGQEQYPIAGAVYGITITNPGTLYAAPPTITIAGPGGGGITATANAIIAAGLVTQVNMTNWGSGYAAIPTVTFSAPGGGGMTATGTAMAAFQIFDLNSVSPLWGTQRYTLGWLPFTPFQAFCRANPTLLRQPSVWTNMTEINTFFVYPIPDQAYLADIDAIGLPSPLVNASDVDAQILPPINDCVQYYAAHLALLKLQNFEQASFYEKKYERRAGQVINTRQDRRVMNVYRNWQRRIARW